MPNTVGGAIRSLPGAATVTSIGTSTTDGWSLVHRFPGADLPSGNGGDYAFVVFGVVGNPVWIEPYDLANTRIEVSLFSSNAPTLRLAGGKFSVYLNHNGIENGSRQGIPFCFIVDAATDNTNLNLSSVDLEVRARMNAARENPIRVTQALPRFEVLDCSILVFDKDVIGSQFRTFQPTTVGAKVTGHIGKAGASDGFEAVTASTSTFGATGEDWLVFHQIQYQPARAPVHFHLVRNASVAGDLSTYGYTQDDAAEKGFHGTKPAGFGFGPGTTGQANQWNLHSIGGFHVITTPEAVDFGLWAREEHRNQGADANHFAHVHHWRYLAIRLDVFPVHAFFDRTNFRTAQAPITYPNSPNRSSYVQREFVNSNYSDFVLLGTATRRTSKNTFTQGHGLEVSLEGGEKIARGGIVRSQYLEGTPNVVAGISPRFRPNTIPVWFNLFLSPTILSSGGSMFWKADDVNLVGFYFETNPEDSPYANQTPGAKVVLRPGGEGDGTDAAALPAFPILPGNSYAENVELPIDELVSHTGYRITIPRFLVVRLVRVFEWPTLTAAQRATLEAFIDTNAGRAVQWTAPGESSAGVFLPIGEFEAFQASTSGKFWSWRVRTVQLVYGTNITPRELS